METPCREKVEVVVQGLTLLVESWVRMKNSVLMVEDADNQEKVKGMVIEETISLSNQMEMEEETEKLVMVKVVEDRSCSFSVTEEVEVRSSGEMEEEDLHCSSEEMEVDTEAIPVADVDLEDFVGIEDEGVVVVVVVDDVVDVVDFLDLDLELNL